MSYIEPSSTIYLCRNVPFKNDYQHTAIFENADAQFNYFYGKRKYEFTRQSYQRKDNGVIRLSALSDSVIDCNYMVFQNTNFSNKWFYAFITNVEYVNNSVCNVHYEIDVLQTWQFDYQLGRCFIERTHTKTDYPGDNLIDEGLETGDFYLTKLNVTHFPFPANDYAVVIWRAAVIDPTPSGTYKCITSNVFNGVQANIFHSPSDAYEYLASLSGQEDSVLSINMLPWNMASTIVNTDTYGTTYDNMYFAEDIADPYKEITDASGKKRLMREFGTYIPINNKLYTAPYFGMLVTSSDGNSIKLNYEYFSLPNSPTLCRRDSFSPTPVSALYPYNYKGVQRNFNEEIVCKTFPLCAWSSDSFKAWLAQNAGSLVASGVSKGISAIGNIAKAAMNPLSLADVSTITQPIGDVATMLGQIYDATIIPDKVRGESGNYLDYTRNTVGFTLYRYQIREEYARIIDAYFNLYGYASHQVAIPELDVRPHWTYIKTKNCVVTGNIPANDINTIAQIFNNGVTVWKKANEVGRYDLDNRPT